MGEKEERVATGVVGFDKLCEGGFLDDSLNLVVGNAGSGKTTFLLQFLNNGATKFGQNGLYVSFEPEIKDIYKTGRKLGMDLEKLDKADKLKIVRFGDGMSIKEMQKRLTEIIAKYGIERVCFDPINVFSVDLPKEVSLRKQIYEFLSLLKKLGVCVLIAGESDAEDESGYRLGEEIKFSKYAVDGVVELFSSGLAGAGDRALRITKMRMTNHVRGPQGMQIKGDGLRVLGK